MSALELSLGLCAAVITILTGARALILNPLRRQHQQLRHELNRIRKDIRDDLALWRADHRLIHQWIDARLAHLERSTDA